MRPARRAFWAVVGVTAACVLAWAWFITTYERESYEARTRPDKIALRNAWLPAEMLLQRFGYRVTTQQEAATLDHLPPGGTLILSNERQYHLTPARTAAVLEWVEHGGSLIADAAGTGTNDPILKAFDVRSTPPRARRPRTDDAEKKDEDEEEKAPRRNERREPARRAVDVPGYGRTLRMYPNAWPMYLGETLPTWQVAGETDKAGNRAYEILAFDRGAGRVMLVNGLWRFHNVGSLERDDHAEILLALVATHQRDGDVRIMARLESPSIFEWLWDNALAALATALALLLFWLWRIIPRFGVVRPEPARPRRSLVQHLRAIGRFLWRHRAATVLLDAARANVRRRLAQRGLAAPDLPVADAAAQLAPAFGIAPEALALALGGTPGTNDQYAAAMATLSDLDRRLNEPRNP